VALVETKVKLAIATPISWNATPHWSAVTNAHICSRSRIWLLWNPDIAHVQILHIHEQYIHCNIKLGTAEFAFRLIYGANQAVKRQHLLGYSVVGR